MDKLTNSFFLLRCLSADLMAYISTDKPNAGATVSNEKMTETRPSIGSEKFDKVRKPPQEVFTGAPTFKQYARRPSGGPGAAGRSKKNEREKKRAMKGKQKKSKRSKRTADGRRGEQRGFESLRFSALTNIIKPKLDR